MNVVGEFLLRSARQHPGRRAVVDGGHQASLPCVAAVGSLMLLAHAATALTMLW